MEKHASNPINYVRIPKSNLELLGNIRHWKNLKLAYEGDFIWLKELSNEQLNTVAIKRIPFHTCYYENGQKLSLIGSLLPNCAIPQVLWTPIQRALPLELPTLNHNYFGSHNKVDITLVLSKKEQEAYALLTNLEDLGTFIKTSASIRLKPLKWTILDEEKALILGTPILPIEGKVYWRWNRFLIPAGYQFNYPSLAKSMHQSMGVDAQTWVLWEKESCSTFTSKELQNLSISSYRKTSTKLQLKKTEN